MGADFSFGGEICYYDLRQFHSPRASDAPLFSSKRESIILKILDSRKRDDKILVIDSVRP